jgi:UDP-N-acetylglucosamine 4,6-dehydratase
MEKMLLASNGIQGHIGPMYSVVRYGNVAGSNGSVIPIFKKQYEQRAPLTITCPDMTRFWITLKEAVRFVAEKLDIMQGGEIFIPEMPSFEILALAMAITGDMNYPKVFTGIRPGEKVHECIDIDRYSNSVTNNWLKVADLKREMQENGLL